MRQNCIMFRVWMTINWDMCQKCIILVLINGSAYATAGPLYREYGSYKTFALRNATNGPEASRTLAGGVPQPAVATAAAAVSAGAVLTAAAAPLSPAMRVGALAGVLCVSTAVLVMCLVNVCAASPKCCPFEPGAIVDSDYSSESLAYARWIDAPRTLMQRCARTLTRLFIPLRAHAFYLPSRTDLDDEEHYRTNPWPARIRALLFLSGGRGFPVAHSCPVESPSPRSLSSVSSSAASPDSRGMSAGVSSHEGRETSRRLRGRLRHGHRQLLHHSEGPPELAMLSARMQFGSFGFPRSLFANSTDLSGKQLLKRLQRLERRLSRSERRALRREAREKRLVDSAGSYGRSISKDRERPSRRRDKKRKKREKKQRERDKRHKEKRSPVEKGSMSPPGSAVPSTSTGEKGSLLLEVLAPAKDVSSSSSTDTVTPSTPVVY